MMGKIIYKTFRLFIGLYWRVWRKEQKSKFHKCGINVRLSRNSDFINSNISIGNNVYIGSRASFIASIAHIHIGNNVMFGPNVTIRGGDHRIDIVGKFMIDVKETEKLEENDQDVFIDNDVWVGCNVTILKGVRIGEGSVIAAGSIVINNIEPYSIYGGVPAKKLKERFTKEEIDEHKKLLNMS